MSDTQFERLNHAQKRIDIIDEDWVLDTLSDDEIDIADALLKLPEEEENPTEQPDVNPEDVWEETGLDLLATEDAGPSASSLLGTYMGHSARPYPAAEEAPPVQTSLDATPEP